MNSKKESLEIKNVTQVFFAWEDEKEEKWLAEMEAEGWKLTSVNTCRYQFQRGNPDNVIYRMDYKLAVEQDFQEHLTRIMPKLESTAA